MNLTNKTFEFFDKEFNSNHNRLSDFTARPCMKCEGIGFHYVPNGPEDYDKEDCAACEGTGRIIEPSK